MVFIDFLMFSLGIATPAGHDMLASLEATQATPSTRAPGNFHRICRPLIALVGNTHLTQEYRSLVDA